MHRLRFMVPSVAALLGPWIVLGCGAHVEGGGTGGQGGAHGTTASVTSSHVSTTSVSSTVASTSTAGTGAGGAGFGGAGTSTGFGGAGTSTGFGGASTSSSTGGGGTVDARPPPPPAMMPPDGTGTTTFAITELFLGDTDPTGTPDQVNGWENYGYNIDGVSPNDFSAFCKTVDNASPTLVHQEGTFPGLVGVENSWGHDILPIFLGIESDTSQKTNDALASGGPTILLTLVQLGSGTSYDPIVARLYQGASLGSTPKHDGTDLWPIDPASLTNTSDPTSAKVQFLMSYVASGTWVSGSTGSVSVTVGGEIAEVLPIDHATITMQMDPTHQNAVHGIISGIISTQALQSTIQKTAGGFDPSLCSGPTIQSILSQIAQASDIMTDGTQDPTQSCNGISIGLGFNATVVQLGPVAPPTPPQPNPCGDAGP